MPLYTLSVTCLAEVSRVVEVEAETEEQARDQALNLACVDRGTSPETAWTINGLRDQCGEMDAHVIDEEESEDEYWDRYVEELIEACPVKFKDMSGRRGAPMGRPDITESFEKPCHLVEVPLDTGGYDPGGAYWGAGVCVGLFCAANDLVGAATPHCAVFVWARTRAEAREAIQTKYPEIKWI